MVKSLNQLITLHIKILRQCHFLLDNSCRKNLVFLYKNNQLHRKTPLKDPSLLAFDKRRREELENLHTVYGIETIPCNSQMRTILDPLELVFLRTAFCTVFREVQRDKDFQKMATMMDITGSVATTLDTFRQRKWHRLSA